MYLKDGRFLFNPSECENCRHLVEGWDYDKHEEVVLRPYSNHPKNEKLLIYDFFDLQLIRVMNPRYKKNPQEQKRREIEKKRKRDLKFNRNWV